MHEGDTMENLLTIAVIVIVVIILISGKGGG